MITLANDSILIEIITGLSILSLIITTLIAIIIFVNILAKEKTCKEVWLTFLVSLVITISLLYGYNRMYEAKVIENVNIVKNLDFIQVYKDDNKQVALYFSDENGQIYKYERGTNVTIHSDVNKEEYEIQFTDDNQIFIEVPWTLEALNYAKDFHSEAFDPLLDEPVAGCVLWILCAEFILFIILFGCNEIFENHNLNFLNYILYILIVAVIPACIIYYVHNIPLVRERNMNYVNQMEIVQNDFDNNIYCADEEGNLEKFHDYELPVDFEYNINYKEFVILEDKLHMPFKKIETKFEE